MRFVSFAEGKTHGYGVVDGDTIYAAGPELAGRYGDLKAVLAAGALATVGQELRDGGRKLPLASVALLPPIGNPGKIFCIGLNYEGHRKETGAPNFEHPAIFVRFPESQVGSGSPMIRPTGNQMFDFEGELAFVIGRRGRRISLGAALGHVAGYACYNDGSVRDWQRHTSQYTPGKNFPATGGFGPWLVSADEIPDPSKLKLTTRLNGEVVQQSGTDDLIFDVPAIIAYLSTFSTLEPGDVVITGTPSGVGTGRKPPLFMKGGDVVEVEIDRIGVLKNPIVDEG